MLHRDRGPPLRPRRPGEAEVVHLPPARRQSGPRARATLLCERWDSDDWSRLLWVRVNLVWLPDGTQGGLDLDRAAEQLRTKYALYRSAAFAGILPFRIDGITGWSASG